jgi:hypothetical protein
MVSKGVERVLSFFVFLSPTATTTTVTTHIPTRRRRIGSNLGEHGTTSLILVVVLFVVFHLSSRLVVLPAGVGHHPIVDFDYFDVYLF